MKRTRIGILVTIGTIVALFVVTRLTHFGKRHVRAGHFDVYTTGKFADSSVSSSLYYRMHELTDYLSGYAVDPNNADRIVFSSDDKYHGDKSVCGTFLYDGNTRLSVLLRNRPYAAGSSTTWSPDSRYLLIDKTAVRDLRTDRETDLGDYVATKDGQRPELTVIQWSPDGQKLAARLDVKTETSDRDQDLVEVTVSPVSVRYVATIRHSSLVWTAQEIRWAGGELHVATPAPTDRTIIVKPPDDLAWAVAAPSVPAQQSIHEGYCPLLPKK